MKTWNAKEGDVERKWWVVDAKGQTLGRLATQIANVLRGKNKPEYTPHVDTGDFVVVVNSKEVKLTGNKWLEKKYYRHSRFFGSLKEFSAAQMLDRDPEFLVKEAVEGMLPDNKLARRMIKKLKVYPGAEHPHEVQKPQAMSVSSSN